MTEKNPPRPAKRFAYILGFFLLSLLLLLLPYLLQQQYLFTQTSDPSSESAQASKSSPLYRFDTVTVNVTVDDANRQNATRDKFLLGVGKADITGPIVEIVLGGYGHTDQKGSGLRQRIYSRAFIMGDPQNPEDRVVYVVLDTLAGDTAIRHGILEGLAALASSSDPPLGKESHGGKSNTEHHTHSSSQKTNQDMARLYTARNVAITGTHSHAGPGAWFNYLLLQIPCYGFDRQSYQAIVDGTLLSIRQAHESITEGYLDIGSTHITDGSINRSLWAYLANPAEERQRYRSPNQAPDEENGSATTDKEMTLLRFQRASDHKVLGALSWFSVHGTSLYGNNTMVAGDNKGVAAYLLEHDHDSDFVGGFSQASVGDTSPNIRGAWCEDGSEKMCSLENSTCSDGTSQACHGRGPAFDQDSSGAKSCFLMGRKQYEGARNILTALGNADRGDLDGVHDPIAPVYDHGSDHGSGSIHRQNRIRQTQPIRGSTVKSFHYYHNMSFYEFALPNGTHVRTCPAALGYSFAAGTTDGPGPFDFTQGDRDKPNANPLWSVVSHLLRSPTPEQKACQGAKPILLDVGEMDKPYAWGPNIVDVQVLRVGSLWIVVSPSEVTTMAGRRWKEAVKAKARAVMREDRQKGHAEEKSEGLSVSSSDSVSEDDVVVVLGGPANTYAHYVSTPEEYSRQRYEGASTLFGPHTLDAYIHLTVSQLGLLSDHTDNIGLASPVPGVPDRPVPPDHRNNSLSFIPGVIRDSPGWGRQFGDCIRQPSQTDGTARSVRRKPLRSALDEKPKESLEMSRPDPSETRDLAQQEMPVFRRGKDTVKATFVGANPRNNLRLEMTYTAVDKLSSDTSIDIEESDDRGSGKDDASEKAGEDQSGKTDESGHDHNASEELVRRKKARTASRPSLGKGGRLDQKNRPQEVWTQVRSDADWFLTFSWRRTSSLQATSEVDIEWEIERWTEPGVYRLHYYGDAKSLVGPISAFDGVSEAFRIE